MADFKVGDYVERIDNDFGNIKVGDRRIITAVTTLDIKFEGDPYYYAQLFFKLVPKTWKDIIGDK